LPQATLERLRERSPAAPDLEADDDAPGLSASSMAPSSGPRDDERGDGRERVHPPSSSLSSAYWLAVPEDPHDPSERPESGVLIPRFSAASVNKPAHGNRLLYGTDDGVSLPTFGAALPTISRADGTERTCMAGERHDDNDLAPTGSMARQEESMLTTQKAARHASLVESAVQGLEPAASIDHLVRDSWTRCIQHYALDPQSPARSSLKCST